MTPMVADLSDWQHNPAQSPENILILIEKDQTTLELYQRELSRDYLVMAFNDETGVMDALAANHVRAVVIEPELHSRRGWELIAAIRQKYGSPSLPVIVCSTRDERGKGVEMGVAAYLVKPVLPLVLSEKIHEIMRTSKNSSRSIL